jgi:hypothetical protein
LVIDGADDVGINNMDISLKKSMLVPSHNIKNGTSTIIRTASSENIIGNNIPMNLINFDKSSWFFISKEIDLNERINMVNRLLKQTNLGWLISILVEQLGKHNIALYRNINGQITLFTFEYTTQSFISLKNCYIHDGSHAYECVDQRIAPFGLETWDSDVRSMPNLRNKRVVITDNNHSIALQFANHTSSFIDKCFVITNNKCVGDLYRNTLITIDKETLCNSNSLKEENERILVIIDSIDTNDLYFRDFWNKKKQNITTIYVGNNDYVSNNKCMLNADIYVGVCNHNIDYRRHIYSLMDIKEDWELFNYKYDQCIKENKCFIRNPQMNTLLYIPIEMPYLFSLELVCVNYKSGNTELVEIINNNDKILNYISSIGDDKSKEYQILLLNKMLDCNKELISNLFC